MKVIKETVLIMTLWALATAGSSRTGMESEVPVAKAVPSENRYNDAQLVEKAVMTGIRIIQSSEVAQTKASNPAILQFAARLIQDHRSANQELMSLAAAGNIPVPTDAYPDKREVMETVNERAGPEFERSYIRDMVKDHIRAVNIYKKGISAAENRQLTDFFKRHLPALQAHLERARMFEGKN